MKSNRSRRLFVLGMIVLTLPIKVFSATESGYQEQATVQSAANVYLQVKPDDEGNIHLSLRDAKHSLTIVCAESGTTIRPSEKSPMQQEALTTARTWPVQALKAENELTLRVRPRGWALFVGRQRVADFSPALTRPFTVSVPKAERVVPEEKGLLQKVAPFKFEDDFMIPKDSDEKMVGWDRVTGKWRLHTVKEDVHLSKKRRRKKSGLPEPTRSPNFYSLEGSGTNGLILAGYDFYDHYKVDVSLIAGEHAHAGIVVLANDMGQFWAFTVSHNPKTDQLDALLWRTETGRIEDRTVIAGVSLETPPTQWTRLEAELFDDTIVCRVDKTEVIRKQINNMPAGGRFGLFAHDLDGVRFDDVSVRSHENLLLENPEQFQRHLVATSGTWTIEASDNTDSYRLRSSAQPRERNLLMGAPDHQRGHRLEATFHPLQHPGEWGVIAGWRGPNLPYYRFSAAQKANQRLYRLERISDGESTVLQHAVVKTGIPKTLPLAIDATEEGLLKCYADGELQMALPLTEQTTGAYGIHVVSQNTVSVDPPRYTDNVVTFRDQFEKNRIFARDPYMRHWSSPEGQWITMPDKKTWYKGDFFGRLSISMPAFQNFTLHIGIPEDEIEGAYTLSTDNEQIQLASVEKEKPTVLWQTPISALSEFQYDEKTKLPSFVLNYEDNALWITTRGKLLYAHHIKEPRVGSRIRAEGLSTEALSLCKVERGGVLDCLFTTSLADWVMNGGTWEVVNRFQCQPRWSHMNGESKDTLAALWSKYQFSGNFCVEFYAGMRHGWYERAGDLNLTVMNDANAPSRGYTITCTGWDPNHSQRHTRLYRNGEVFADSEKYLVPRGGKNTRKGYNPLIASGRGLHGAWYYMKLRRHGDTLQYSFDNEPVFTCEDSDTLTRGSLGVWTYRNSMMVARVKVAADSISPKPIGFQKIDVASLPQVTSLSAPAPPPAPREPKFLANGQRLDLNQAEHWVARDPVSHPIISDLTSTNNGVKVTARQAAGSFASWPIMSDIALDKISGWEFDFACSPGAGVNVHYQLGRGAGEKFKPLVPMTQRLTGTALTDGPRVLMADNLGIVPAAARDTPESKWNWKRVRLVIQPPQGDVKAKTVRFEGFGTLQPSEVEQGLKGNAPGDWYAIRNFSPIFLGTPELEVTDSEHEALAAELKAKIGQTSGKPGLHELALPFDSPTLLWRVEPALEEMKVDWHPDIPDALTLTAPGGALPRTLYTFKALQVDNQNAPLILRPGHIPALLLKRPVRPTAEDETFEVLFNEDKRAIRARTPPLREALDSPPVLISAGGSFEHMLTFEEREFPALTTGGTRATVNLFPADPIYGTVRVAANEGQNAGLAHTLITGMDMIRFPVLQFSYKADPDARTQIRYQGDISMRFSTKRGVNVRGTGPAKLDDTWHTWWGLMTDAAKNTKASVMLPNRSRIEVSPDSSSGGNGLYSELSTDNLVCGPVVGPKRPLSLQPTYSDLSGIRKVEYALVAGGDLFKSRKKDADTLSWTSIPNAEPSPIPYAQLEDGMHRLLLRACDEQGKYSAISDLPFLVDSVAPEVTHRFEALPKYEEPKGLLQLQCPLSTSLADFRDVKISAEDQQYGAKVLKNGVFRNHKGKNTISFDWLPLLADVVANKKDGDTVKIRIAGIKDGADNAASAHEVLIPIDYESDETPPRLTSMEWPANIAAGLNAGVQPTMTIHTKLRPYRSGMKKRSEEADGTPFLDVRFTKREGGLSMYVSSAKYDLSTHPYLSTRMKIPQEKVKSPRSLWVVVRARNGATVKAVLAKEKKPGDGLIFAKTLQTQPGVPKTLVPDKWTELTMNIKELFKPEELEKLKGIITVSLLLKSHKNQKQGFALESIWLHADWQHPCEVSAKGLDLSGIAGLTLTPDGKPETMRVSLSNSSGKDGNAWPALYLHDRAGNVTPPIRIPYRTNKQPEQNETDANARKN